MRMMGAEERKGKVCKTCGETRSVKYTQNGHTWCNRCVLKETWEAEMSDAELVKRLARHVMDPSLARDTQTGRFVVTHAVRILKLMTDGCLFGR